MKIKALWAILLVGFVAANGYVLATNELAGMVAYLTNLGPWGTLLVMDLMIALTIGVGWMWRDAKVKGIGPIPYAMLTVASGSVGLLVYLVRHGGAGDTTTCLPEKSAPQAISTASGRARG